MAIGVNANITSGDIASDTATTVITKPTGFAATDILIAVFGNEQTGASCYTTTQPAGWTAVSAPFTATNNTNSLRLSVYWALGSVASLTFTNSATAQSQGWACLDFTGVNNVNPIDLAGVTNSINGAASLTTNAMTPLTTGAVHVIACKDWLGGSAETFTATGFTAKKNGGVNATAAMLYNLTAKTAGVSTGTVAVTASDAAAGQILAAVPFLLRPATFAPPPMQNFTPPVRWY